MTFDTHFNMIMHEVYRGGGYSLQKDQNFNAYVRTSTTAVKFRECVRDVGVVTGNQSGSQTSIADVKHKEAHLSCSSSDYDDHVDLSTNKEDLMHIDMNPT